MIGKSKEVRFLEYQVKAIQRFQNLREPQTPEEAQLLAMEWIRRFAGSTRTRWEQWWKSNASTREFEQKIGEL